MEHLLLKAAITAATDQGKFTAVISASSVDRERDIVDPAGMVRALHKWVPTGKKIPLAWNHSTAPEHQIGYIDPATARVKGGEVVADGWIDQSVPSGADAWRQVKMNTLGFSFGYLTLDSAPRKGGGRLLKELDVFEVTATATPMNNDTRVIAWKAAKDVMAGTSDAEVEEGEQDTLETVIELMGDFLDTEDDAQDIAAARDILIRLQQLLNAESAEVPGKSVGELRAQADAVALELAAGAEIIAGPAPESPPEPVLAEDKTLTLLFATTELDGAIAGELKAVWTSAYVNGLPDSAFLYIEPGGTQDDEGKTTPRALRHFPVKDASGNVDMPHLRNALARIPQSNLSQEIQDSCVAKAQKLMDRSKSVDGAAQAEWRAADPLRAKAEALALEIASGGMSLQESPPSPPAQKAPAPDPIPLDELRERSRAQMLAVLSGMEDITA